MLFASNRRNASHFSFRAIIYGVFSFCSMRDIFSHLFLSMSNIRARISFVTTIFMKKLISRGFHGSYSYTI